MYFTGRAKTHYCRLGELYAGIITVTLIWQHADRFGTDIEENTVGRGLKSL